MLLQPRRLGEVNMPLKILRNCLFPISYSPENGFVCRSFLVNGKIPYLQPKHNQHQEGLTDSKDNNRGLEAMTSSFGLQGLPMGLHEYV